MRFLNPILRAVLVVMLAVFLALPESVRAHSDNTASEISEHEHADQSAHGEGATSFADLCHPGPDCIVTAVVAFQPTVKISEIEVRAAFSVASHAPEGSLLLFDPPPPRAWS